MEYVKIGDICTKVCSGGTPSSGNPSYYEGGSIPWLNTNEVNFCRIYSTEKKITQLGYENSAAKYIDENSVIVAMYGVTAGKSAIAKIRLTTNQACCNLSIDGKKADYEYVYYYLKLQSETLNKLANGGAQQNLNSKIIKDFKIPLPPLAIQHRIASILSAYDSQIENNQKRIKLLEQMAENLYKEWFVRFRFPDYETAEFEGGVPKGWKVVKVKECVDRLRFGTLYGKDSVESDGDVIVIDQSQEPYIGFHNNAPSHIADTQKPIILFGDHSCKFELMIIPFSLAENVVPFVAKSGIDTTFLYFTTHNLIQTTEYKRHWTEFVNKKILLPPANLQREYAKKVIDILSMKQQLIVENRLLSKQRDLLLPRLMSGKLSI